MARLRSGGLGLLFGLILAGTPALVHETTVQYADVPLACSLSGGLDSSAIVGFLAASGVKVRTYSLGFTGAAEAHWNELPLARTERLCGVSRRRTTL